MNEKRRNFLKTSALLSVAASSNLTTFAFGDEIKTGLVKDGEVLTAAYWGMMKATLKDGKIVGSKAFQTLSELENPLRDYTGELVYNKARVKYPMVRKSYLANPDSPKPELRGRDEWVRVRYEDAIKLVARELKKTRKQKGLSSVYAKSPAWKSSGNVHSSTTLLHRFMNLTGGFVGGLGDYSTGAGQVIMTHVTGSIEVYEQQTSWNSVLANSKVVVIWGSDPVTTLRVGYTAADEMALKYLEDLKKSNIEIIIIDPVKSETGKYFDKAKWLAPRPNTDTAMMLGMAYHLYQTGNYSKEFLENYTVGFEKFLPYLLGETDGTPKTPKWASEICTIDEETIKQLALKIYQNRTMIMGGWAMQRAHHGEQPYWMLVTLAAMLGQIGQPGGGFGFSYHYAGGGVPTALGGVIGGMNPADIGVIKDDKFIGYAKDVADEKLKKELDELSHAAIPVARVADMLLNPGKTIDHNGTKIIYPDIDFIYWAGGNAINHQQNINKNVKAWQKPRTIVVNEMYWTPTAKMADIVFPVTTPYERNDITMVGDYSNQYISPIKQLVEKQFEAKDDYQIFSDLCKAYADGLVEIYTEGGKSDLDFVKKCYDLAAKAVNGNPNLGISMPEFNEWWSKNEAIKFEATPESEEWVRFGEFVEDPILNPLGTPSGLIEIYSETIATMNYDDCKGHAMWIEPAEWLGMKDKPASIHLVSPHPSNRLHSQLNQTSLRDKFSVAGREPIVINTKNAKALGVKNGDLVRVYNERGEVLAGAIVTDEIRQDVARLAEGAWYDPDANGLCKNGCPNVLTNDIPSSKLTNANIAHTALVNIEKFKGVAPKLSAFNEPKFSK
ncbi:molybdopterin-dependent oxidoreductase [Campylobacter curvus]|uniref:molybdopterin-dependent oxidoreductase n=1 Tax=Campylobacter curvus TaxID=200 RepID=UPI001470258D|nr:molybdopterin-dependent oxidoreductase [Campylobacter curvus]